MKDISNFEERILTIMQILVQVFFLLAIFVVVQSIPYFVAGAVSADQQSVAYNFTLMILFVFSLIVIYVWLKSIERKDSNFARILLPGNTLIYIFGLMLGSNYIISCIRYLFASMGYNTEPVTSIFFIDSSAAAMILRVLVFAPILEDLFFRGLIPHCLRELFGPKQVIVISSTIFGILHFSGTGGGLYKTIYSGVLGVIFCTLYLRSRDIKVSIIAHAMFNFIPIYRSFIIAKMQNGAFLDAFRGTVNMDGGAIAGHHIVILFFAGILLFGLSSVKLHNILLPFPDSYS